MPASIRLVLAEDHAIVLHGLKRLFESEPDFEVVDAVRSGREALEAARRACDVLVLDFRLPDMSGVDVLRMLAAERPRCRVVMLTATIGDDDVVQALQLGVNGVVLKESSPEQLLECLRRVHQGEQWIDREMMSRAVNRVTRREAASREASKVLTPREIEIVRMIAQGLRNRAIAERLSISEGTVKIHLHNVYEKLDIDGRLELMLYAQEKELV